MHVLFFNLAIPPLFQTLSPGLEFTFVFINISAVVVIIVIVVVVIIHVAMMKDYGVEILTKTPDVYHVPKLIYMDLTILSKKFNLYYPLITDKKYAV